MVNSAELPDPMNPYPWRGTTRIGLLKPLVNHPQISVGDFTYHDAEVDAARFEVDNVLYAHEAMGDRLTIGKYCSIARGVRFFLGSGNHPTEFVSTFPFPLVGFGGDATFLLDRSGDIVVGNDVWFGNGATVLPGVTIGDGAVIGASAVVASDVRPYAIVVGNPGREVRRRFSDADVEWLCALKWWNWPVERVAANARLLATADVSALRSVCEGQALDGDPGS